MAAESTISRLRQLASRAISGLRQESSLLQTLHHDVRSALARVQRIDPGIKAVLRSAHGYAVFPSIGQAAAVLGGAFGKGEVFERQKLVGYAGLVQLTLGVQLGGQTFTQIIVFDDKAALNRFKEGKSKFTAQAAAVLVKAGAAASTRYDNGAAVLVYPEGGLLVELGLGAQKFIFGPAVLGRAKPAPKPLRSTPRKPAPPRQHAEPKHKPAQSRTHASSRRIRSRK